MIDPTRSELPITYRGRFWLPEHPNLVFTGELVISAPKRYDLLLDLPHYGLGSPAYWESRMGRPIPMLLGITDEGRDITVADCVIYSATLVYRAERSVSWHRLKIAVHRCFIGMHIEDLNAVRFDAFSAYYTGFNQLASAYDSEIFEPGDPNALTKVKRKDIIEGFGELCIFAAGYGGGQKFGNVSTKQELRYWRPHFTPTTPVSVDEVLDTIGNFQRLLCLLEGEPVGFDHVRAEQQVTDADVELLAMMTGFKKGFEPRHTTEMLVPMKIIGDRWPTTVSNWFDSVRQLAPVLNLYFAVVYSEQLFDEHKFLFLAQAIEGYHRCRINQSNLQFGRRLSEVVRSAGAALSPLVSDVSAFCAAVVTLRNDLTHPGPTSNWENRDAWLLWQQLKTLLEICLLRDLGLSEDVLERVARVHIDRHR